MYALVDCNNFYVSCERVFDPSVRNKPVIVLSNNDGCAISRSDEAKAIGIEMGAIPHMISHLLKANDVKIFSSNYTLYGDMSSRVMKMLSAFAPRMEVFSIDEAFLDLTEIPVDQLHQHALKIRTAILQSLDLPTCIGIAPTKTLAKMANSYAKKNHKTIGVFAATDKAKINEMMSQTAIGDVWGIGPQYNDLLTKNGLKNALDFSKLPADFVRSKMSVVGLRTHHELNGVSSLPWETITPGKKSIASSRSFGELITDKTLIKEALANYAASCALKLRNQRSVAGKLSVFIHTNPHRLQDEQYYQSINVTLATASNHTADIIKYAFKGLDLIFRPGFNYLKCGIEVADLVPENEFQINLFDTALASKSNKTKATFDKINKDFGKEIIRFGSQGNQKAHQPRIEHLSKRFTTRLREVLKIKN